MNRVSLFPILSYLLVTFVIIVAVVVLFFKANKAHFANPPPSFQGPIYCLMVTGKDDERLEYARKSVANFLEQTYDDKTLIIINHHPTIKVINLEHPTSTTNIHEFRVDKTPSLSLGALRNIGLQLVAHDACWTTWDDDDYRHPTYLKSFAELMPSSCDAIVTLTKRVEYIMAKDTSFVGTKSDGYVLFLAPLDHRITYLHKDSMEDTEIVRDYKAKGYHQIVYNNNPIQYIRLVHKNNTSLYVRSNRDYLMIGPSYTERLTNVSERDYIDSVKHKFLLSPA